MTTAPPVSLYDQRISYGAVSRCLHWLMALLFAWQFTGAILHVVSREWAISGFFWGTHRPLGFLLFVLVIVRGVWGLLNLSRRPGHHGFLGFCAKAGHAALYALMIFVPGVALLRQFGSGRGFEPFGIPLMSQTGVVVEWMRDLGNAVHGLTGWFLLALVGGHIAMVLVHQLAWKDGTLSRMAGRGRSPAALQNQALARN